MGGTSIRAFRAEAALHHPVRISSRGFSPGALTQIRSSAIPNCSQVTSLTLGNPPQLPASATFVRTSAAWCLLLTEPATTSTIEFIIELVLSRLSFEFLLATRPEEIYRRLNRLAEEERQLRSLLRLSLRVIRSDAKAESAEVSNA